jgi:hypothetical protein
VIEAHAFFGQIVKPETTADSRRWSFYTALRFPSSTCAPERRARLRLRSFGRESVRNVGNWHAMAAVCESKGMAVIADRFVACAWDG